MMFIFWISVLIMTAKTDAQIPDAEDFFEGTEYDLSKVTWGHAINNEELLEEFIDDPNIMMLEADVSYGTLTSDPGEKIPIMAHPPLKTSDLSLNDWILKVIKANKEGKKKGAKLDFKDLTIVSASLEILSKYKSSINFPLWLNADIIEGPGSSHQPIDADIFLSLCREFFPSATLSLGWTTGFDAQDPERKYTPLMIDEMIQTIDKNNIQQPITFPVRATFAQRSEEEFDRLLGALPGNTITIWSSPKDDVNAEELLTFQESVGEDIVFMDLPKNQQIEFDAVRQASVSSATPSTPIFPSQTILWATVSTIAGSLMALYFSSN